MGVREWLIYLYALQVVLTSDISIQVNLFVCTASCTHIRHKHPEPSPLLVSSAVGSTMMF